MKKPRRRSKVMILLVLLGAAGFIVWKSRVWEPLVYEESFEETLRDGELLRSRNTWGRYGWMKIRYRSESYYTRSGYLGRVEAGFKFYDHDGTVWDLNGRVLRQRSISQKFMINTPPWRWGMTDQLKPNPPAWFYDDSLFEKGR